MSLQSNETARTRTRAYWEWTPEQDAILRTHYPNWARLSELMPTRSKQACKKRAQTLHMTHRVHKWTAREVNVLRANWLTELKHNLMTMLPGLTWRQISSMAKHLKLPNRGKEPYKLTGHPLHDAIRDRCRLIGMSMRQLDEDCGTGNYWNSRAWHFGGHRMPPMLKAVNVLGGTLSVVWPDDGECIDKIDVGGS